MSWAALRKLAIFGVVGGGASLIHILAAWALTKGAATPVFVANVLGFGAAFLWSYFGHYHWTFQSSTGHKSAFGRFLAVALSGFAINNLVVLVWSLTFGAASIWAVTAGVILAAGAVFLASNYWAFSSRSC